MGEYEINTNYLSIIAGTSNTMTREYREAVEENDKGNAQAMGHLKNFITSIESLASKENVKDERISSSRGNIKQFKGYDNIKVALGFLDKNLKGTDLLKELHDINAALESCATQFTAGYDRNVRLIILEYESAVYLLVTGLSMLMATRVDVVQNGTSIKIQKKSGTDMGVIAKTIREMAKQMSAKTHKDYLEDLLKSKENLKINVNRVKVQNESVAFTESAVSDTLELIDSIINNVSKIGGFVKRTIVGFKKSFFGIIPLIRSCLYLRYKKKADTILALEQQIQFINQNIEQLQNIKTMDPAKKNEIIQKQKAIVEQYRKKAEKLRAELCETEKEAATEIKKEDPQLKDVDDDFVLEWAGLDPFVLGYPRTSEFTERTKKAVRNPGNVNQRRREKVLAKMSSGTLKRLNGTPLSSEDRHKADLVIAELRAKTNRDSIKITLGERKIADNNPTDRFKSKFGGTPYWPKDMKYPVYNGKPMYMLAQVNFSEMPRLAGYPTSGILQFFALNMDYFDNDELCKVIYHPNPSKSVEQLDPVPVTTIGVDIYGGNLPIGGVCFFDKCTIEKVCIQPSCNDFADMIKPILEKHFGTTSVKNYSVNNYIYDAISAWGHRIGGWPNFTQYDVMTDKYNRLLLQIDTEMKKGIEWGDCGIGNLFINDKALASKDFKDVLCTWDCC